MKKQTKRVFGLCGLAVVGVTTAIAASLPAPTTAAIGADSTDTVIVRVASDRPEVSIGGIVSGDTILSPEQTFTINSSDGVDFVNVTLTYTDVNGNTDTYDFGTHLVNYTADTWTLPVNLTNLTGAGGLNFSYGHYELTAVATGSGGATHTDAKEFDYVSAEPEDGGVDENDNVIIDIEGDGKNDSEVSVYDGNGNLIPCLSVKVPAGTTKVVLPFADCGISSGDYKIVIKSIDEHGNVISVSSIEIGYTAPGDVPVPSAGGDGGDTPVPNTGSITANLNISRTDYLITGIVVLVVTAVLGITIMVKRKRSSKRKS